VFATVARAMRLRTAIRGATQKPEEIALTIKGYSAFGQTRQPAGAGGRRRALLAGFQMHLPNQSNQTIAMV
jgi:hypothetical protein